MKRAAMYWTACLALLMGGGCVTAEQREATIEKGALEAAELAHKEAKELALKRGLPDAEAEALAKEAAKTAYKTARETLEKVAPQADSGWLGKLLTGLTYVAVNFGLPLLGGTKA